MTSMPPDDPKQIWQSQRKEGERMSLEEVREKARRFHAKTRRNNAIGVVFIAAAVVFCIVVVFTARQTMPRVVAGLVAIALVENWIRAGYRVYKRRGSPDHASAEAATAPALEHYRHELLRELRYAEIPKSRVAIAAVITGLLIWESWWRSANPLPVRVMMPFLLLMVGFMIIMVYVRIRETRKLREELAELDEFENSL